MTFALLIFGSVSLACAFYIRHRLKRLLAAARRSSNPAGGDKGSPDRRGMGPQSDFISETFVPSEAHRAQQISMARTLIAAGSQPVQVAALLTIPAELITPKPAPGALFTTDAG